MSDDGGSAMSVDGANYHGHRGGSLGGGVWRDTSGGSAASTRGAAASHDHETAAMCDYGGLRSHVSPLRPL